MDRGRSGEKGDRGRGVTKDTESERAQCNKKRHQEMDGRSDVNIERVRDKSEKEIEFYRKESDNPGSSSMTEEGAASVGSCCNHRNGWKRKRKWQKIECGFAEPCSPAAALSSPYQRERERMKRGAACRVNNWRKSMGERKVRICLSLEKRRGGKKKD